MSIKIGTTRFLTKCCLKRNDTVVNILELKDITKIYPGGIVANYKINFNVREGEIHALVGENGAGKSTLMKILFGFEDMTSGEIFYKGQKVHFKSSQDAIKNGIGMVHQHFMLVPSLTVYENLVLGVEYRKFVTLIDKKRCREDALAISKKYNIYVDVDKTVRDISVGMKQKLEILKVLYRGARTIILDEPTAVLTPQETGELFEALLNLKQMGYTIIFISHKLDEVKQISDRLTVLKLGGVIGTYNTCDLTKEEISRLMVGRTIEFKYDKTVITDKNEILRVENISYTNKFKVKKLNGVSFNLNSGEVLGLAGVEGNGQQEAISIINGMIKADSGKVFLKCEDITNYTIKERRNKGISIIPEDRMSDGCATDLSIEDNIISIDSQNYTNRLGAINRKVVNNRVNELIKKFSILCLNKEQKIKMLSGGNIQKTIVAREFNTGGDVLVLDQPTRGIDVGSIEFIHKKILEKRNSNKAVLLLSADLSELLAISDRILVFYKGKISGNIEKVESITEPELGLYMLGVKNNLEDGLQEGTDNAKED